MATDIKEQSISEEFIDGVINSIREGKKLKRRLPTVTGEIFIDRQLPFLCVYRYPSPADEACENAIACDWGTDHLLLGESSYLLAPGDESLNRSVSKLVESISSELHKSYGAFLVLEIWAGAEVVVNEDTELRQPGFKVLLNHDLAQKPYVKTLAKELSLIHLHKASAKVQMVSNEKVAPPAMPELLSPEKQNELGIHFIGLEISPVYRDLKSNEMFSRVLHKLESQLTRTLEKTFFDFLKLETTICPPSYLALGRRSPVHAVVQVDRVLFEVADQIDFLLLVTPTNSQEAYYEFQHNLFQRKPRFTYHPLPFDAAMLKRKLYAAPVEEIEDPTLAQLFREQQIDIDHRISMVAYRGGRNFLYSSLQLFEKPDDELVALADRILCTVSEVSEKESLDSHLTAEQFRERAQKELDYYKREHPDLPASVQIREDVPGVLVSQGNLIIGSERKILTARAEALLSHEVGTHILTNYNGRQQPFRQMCAGLPGYDELQEPLAVLSEYLVGGLSNRRMRTLASRVLAVGWMVDGATFQDVFRKLTKDYDLHKEIAFSVTMRVFRSGGFTKDVVYLRGLLALLDHLRHGLDIEMLYIGKFGLHYLPIVRELLWRNVLTPAVLKPHFFESEEALKRLEQLRKGATVFDLIEK